LAIRRVAYRDSVDYVPDRRSCPSDLVGEAAFGILLPPGASPCARWLASKGVTSVDACGACAVRALAEFTSRRQQEETHVESPADSKICRLFWTLLGQDLPGKVILDTEPKVGGSRPAAVLLPACCLRTLQDVDDYAAMVPQLASAHDRRSVAVITTAFAHLAENALQHAGDSPIPPIAAITFEKDVDLLRLSVLDVGSRIARLPDAEEELRLMVKRSQDGDGHGLSLLMDYAVRMDRDVRLQIATGIGRLQWDSAGKPRTTTGWQVEGFAAWLDLPIPR
jgi:hypothetical protein